MERFKLPDMNKEISVTKTFRLKYSLIERLEEVANKNNMSVNRLITECLEFALRNLEFKDEKNKK